MQPQGGQNPFMQTLQGLQSKGAAGGAPNPLLQRAAAGAAPDPGGMAQGIQQGAGGQGAPGGGVAGKFNQPSTMPGGNPGSTDSLIKALSALNQVITATDDPQEIQLARQVIMLLQKMIQMDQSKQGGRDSAFGQAAEQSQMAPPNPIQAPGGQLPQGPVPGGPPQGPPGLPPGMATQGPQPSATAAGSPRPMGV